MLLKLNFETIKQATSNNSKPPVETEKSETPRVKKQYCMFGNEKKSFFTFLKLLCK
jgi:hypothetical protein